MKKRKKGHAIRFDPMSQYVKDQLNRLKPKIDRQIELLGHPPTLQDLENAWNKVLSEDIGKSGMKCVTFTKEEKTKK